MGVSADVVVVGAGIAGFCTALEASDLGADVSIIEKRPVVGGSSILSGGSMAFAGTDMQRAAGIEDSSELLFEDIREVGGYENDPALVQLYVDHQLETFEWLRSLGVNFGPIQLSSGQSVPRTHPVDPPDLIRGFEEESQRRANVRIMTDTAARRLIRNPKTRRVTGVEAEHDGETLQIEARHGVILTSGGFSRNEDLILRFAPGQKGALLIGGDGNVGDGLKMGWHLGAGFRDMPFIKGTFGNHPTAKSSEHTACLAVYKGAIAVNQDGQRFVDESISYKLLGDACLRQSWGVAYQILDQDIFEKGVVGVRAFDFERRLEQNLLIRADTLEELAEKIEVPVQTLVETVERYNNYVETGCDEEFGRDHLAHKSGDLVKINRAPFYAFASSSAIVATYCGLTVDTGMQVLDVFNEPIEGLYAAGEVVGGFHGIAYMTGTSLGKGSIFGRIAARSAVGMQREEVAAS